MKEGILSLTWASPVKSPATTPASAASVSPVQPQDENPP